MAFFRKRYAEEREKRLKPEGLKQYANVATSEKFKKFWEDPWVEEGTPINNPVEEGGHCRLLILGAGAHGLLQAARAIDAGVKVDDICIVDVAAGFGGAFYWNRYPGVMCDTEAYCYMPMLEEMDYMPTRKFTPGEEIRLHYDRIAKHYGLHKRAMWQTWSNSATWDAHNVQWDVELTQKPKGGQETPVKIHADFIVIAAGLQSVPKMPNLPGIEDFQGHIFHASRWDYDYTGGSPAHQHLWGLTDKRVAIIGNAATGAQAIVEVAKYAKEVYSFQRTPARIHPRHNPNTDVVEWRTKTAAKPGWQKARNQNFNAYVNHFVGKPEVDSVDDGHTKLVTWCANFGSPRNITPEILPQ